LVATLFGAPAESRAENVAVELTAVVFHVDEQTCWCLDGISVGDTLVAYYTYSTDTVDSNPDPQVGNYAYSSGLTQIAVYLDNYVFRTAPANVNVTFRVTDGVVFGGGFPEDRYDFSSWNNVLTIPSNPTVKIQVHLGDDRAQVFTDDALPQIPPDLNSWGYFHAVALLGTTWYVVADIVSIESGPPTSVGPLPIHLSLDLQGFPNPFAGTTTISWRAPEHETVTLRVYDMSGSLVRQLSSDNQPGDGHGSVVWDGTDSSGRKLASGIYFVRAATASMTDTRKLVLLR